MTWEVEFDDAFEPEFAAFSEDVQDALLAVAKLPAGYGPHLGRPHADTLKGSKHANMKELRFEASDGEWRAFAFDPRRKAIVLVAGDKSRGDQKRFYQRLVTTADRRFSVHLERLKAATKKGK